jgi:hypothetical protein
VRAIVALLAVLVAASACAEDVPALFVAVGYGGRRMTSRDGVKWENDQRWSDKAADDDNVLFNIAFGAGKFVAVGGAGRGRIVTTRDGIEWRELPEVKGRVATIAFGNGRFVAGHDAELLWSLDGEHFEKGERLGWEGSVHARRSAFGDTEAGKMFVIIGDVDIWAEKTRVGWRASTADGATYLKAAHHTPPARDIAYGSGHFVVVGPGGLIESSHDGQTWERHETGVTDDLSRIVWTGVRFLVSGGKTAWSSPDGLSWKAEAKPIPCGIAWGREDRELLGIGFSWGGGIHVTRDFAEWKKLPFPPGPSLEAVAYGVPRLPIREATPARR